MLLVGFRQSQMLTGKKLGFGVCHRFTRATDTQASFQVLGFMTSSCLSESNWFTLEETSGKYFSIQPHQLCSEVRLATAIQIHEYAMLSWQQCWVKISVCSCVCLVMCIRLDLSQQTAYDGARTQHQDCTLVWTSSTSRNQFLSQQILSNCKERGLSP